MSKYFLIMKGGKVQHSQQPSGLFMPIFTDYREATEYAKRHGATVAEVGTVEGETLDAHLRAASEMGVKGLLITDGTGHPIEPA